MINYCSVDVEGCENFINFSSTVFLADFCCGKSQELGKVNTSRLIIIKFCEDLINKLVLTSESQRDESVFQLLWINNSRVITIEDIKSLFDIPDLLNRNSHSNIVLGGPSLLFRGFRLMFSSRNRCLSGGGRGGLFSFHQ